MNFLAEERASGRFGLVEVASLFLGLAAEIGRPAEVDGKARDAG